MSTPPAPPQAELQDRPFSFFPAIHGVESNEWTLTEATWSEMMVRNVASGIEVPIPRRYFGAISETDKPVRIVGLTHELEYRTGAVWPVRKKVLEMEPPPMLRVVKGAASEAEKEGPHGLAAIAGLSSTSTESRASKLIGITFLAIFCLIGVVWAVVKFTPEAKPTFVAKDQSYLELNREDDYYSIQRRLGKPSGEEWKPDSGELQYQALFYKDRGYAVILMGEKRESVRYIGTMSLGKDGKGWSPLHSVEFARGASTYSLLKTLPRF